MQSQPSSNLTTPCPSLPVWTSVPTPNTSIATLTTPTEARKERATTLTFPFGEGHSHPSVACFRLLTTTVGYSRIDHNVRVTSRVKMFDFVGMESMRRSVLGGPLPGARSVSLHLFPDVDRPDTKRTFFLMSFGQFLDHDLTHTAITKASRDDVCECDTCSTRHFRLKATSS